MSAAEKLAVVPVANVPVIRDGRKVHQITLTVDVETGVLDARSGLVVAAETDAPAPDAVEPAPFGLWDRRTVSRYLGIGADGVRALTDAGEFTRLSVAGTNKYKPSEVEAYVDRLHAAAIAEIEAQS